MLLLLWPHFNDVIQILYILILKRIQRNTIVYDADVFFLKNIEILIQIYHPRFLTTTTTTIFLFSKIRLYLKLIPQTKIEIDMDQGERCLKIPE